VLSCVFCFVGASGYWALRWAGPNLGATDMLGTVSCFSLWAGEEFMGAFTKCDDRRRTPVQQRSEPCSKKKTAK
jgi:hypothetical protein